MTNTTSATGTKRRPGELDGVGLACEWLWAFRLELALLALVGGAFAALLLRARLPALTAGLIVGAAVLGVVMLGPVRRGVGGALYAAHVRRGWRRAWLHCGLPAVHAGRVERVPAGERVRGRVSRGSAFDQVAAKAEELAECLRVRELRVARDPANASEGTVTVVRRDPFAGLGGRAWPRLDAERLSLWVPVPLGTGEQGETVSVSLAERNMLLGGEPGAGKSAALLMLIAAAALDPTVRLWLLDGKRVELAPWASCAERLVGPDVGEAIGLLERVQGEMEERYRQLLAVGLRKIAPDSGMPLHVVVCDELVFYLTCEDRKQRARFAELLRDLVARGRAAGVIVLAATQKPSADVVPSALRDLFGFRLALRCTTPQASDTILGQGWASQGHNAGTIAPADRGVGFLLADDGLPVKLRTFYLDDEQVTQLATRASAQRRGRTPAPAGAITGPGEGSGR
ncbi:MAG: FtsK/SpoIIIE domain-containing protein [Solirubrobacteraceae bacterium]